MNNADFWASMRTIIAEGFMPEGLLKLDGYAEQFISGKLVYQRFSPQEQHGCSAITLNSPRLLRPNPRTVSLVSGK